MSKFVTLSCVLAVLFAASEAANILCIFTNYSPSYVIIHMSYARALVERGHNVTIVTAMPLKDKNPRYHHIYIPPTEASIKKVDENKARMSKPLNGIQRVHATFTALMTLSSLQYYTIKDQRFQDFMHNPDNKFDLLIMGYFLTDYELGLGLHFKCPIVLSWVTSSNQLVNRFVGNPTEISYVPALPMGGVQDLLTFTGRLKNFIGGMLMKLNMAIIDMIMEKSYKEIFPSPDYPSLEEARKKVSLLLYNSHFSEGVIRPNVPAAVEVGGIQIKDKPDPLPKDLQVIVNASSEHGVILLSFGSNLRSTDMNPAILQTIFNAVAGLKQTVLWKWDGEEKLGDAPNIHYNRWLPQDDLLAHPNVKLFITHAGKGSIVESQFHGVPMVAIPIFGDQLTNAEQVAMDGFGVAIDHKTMTTEALRAAILEVLGNQTYREKVTRFSTLYRDRPMSAKDTAVYWIEYVIRHKGAYHMQSPLVHLNGWQYVSADVAGFLLLVVFCVYKAVKITTRYLLRKVSAKKQKVKQQ